MVKKVFWLDKITFFVWQNCFFIPQNCFFIQRSCLFFLKKIAFSIQRVCFLYDKIAFCFWQNCFFIQQNAFLFNKITLLVRWNNFFYSWRNCLFDNIAFLFSTKLLTRGVARTENAWEKEAQAAAPQNIFLNCCIWAGGADGPGEEAGVRGRRW